MRTTHAVAESPIPTALKDLPPWGWHTWKVENDHWVQVHCVPLGDYRQHEYNERCWCCPEEFGDEGSLFRHNALDNRTWYDDHPLH